MKARPVEGVASGETGSGGGSSGEGGSSKPQVRRDGLCRPARPAALAAGSVVHRERRGWESLSLGGWTTAAVGDETT